MSYTIQPVVLTVLLESGKILLTKRSEKHPEDAAFNNVWQIPGGGLEFAETPEQTAMREAREELGIEVQVDYVLPYIYTTVRGNWQGILLPYRCSRRFPEQEIVLNDESTEYRWVSRKDYPTLPLTPFTELIIKRVFEHEG
ncbi:MAG: NUDIX hydrolase [Patescibacteria group bacterium]|nr:NUDIX hydrolase [Patescibacteria group bacterium]